MPQSYPTASGRSRPFICTPYKAGPKGRIVAEMPNCCPTQACSTGGATACAIWLDHERQRKTGPPHPLAVACCSTHDVAFTLYPPGYGPYQRQPVLRLSYDGSPIRGDEHNDEQRKDFAGTVFEAALDARDGVAWARRSAPEATDAPERYWAGQGRHLRRTARLMGVAAELSDRVRESIARVLSVVLLDLREGSRSTGYRAIGKAVCSVLARVRGGARRAFYLLVCGAVTGDWGEPLLWDPKRRKLERSPFPRCGTGTGP